MIPHDLKIKIYYIKKFFPQPLSLSYPIFFLMATAVISFLCIFQLFYVYIKTYKYLYPQFTLIVAYYTHDSMPF